MASHEKTDPIFFKSTTCQLKKKKKKKRKEEERIEARHGVRPVAGRLGPKQALVKHTEKVAIPTPIKITMSDILTRCDVVSPYI